MHNNSKKTIIIVLIVALLVAGFFTIRHFQDRAYKDMLRSIITITENAGLENVSIEEDSYDKGEFFLRSSNFNCIDWSVLFSMHEQLLSTKGVVDIVYSMRVNNAWELYYIKLKTNTIEYRGKDDIDYIGSWENGKAHSYVSLSAIQADLNNRTTTNTNTTSNQENDAKVCAKKAVEDQLKSPSTAKFCTYTEMTATNLGGNKWKITGYVDAQNSFGATLRENWTVTLTLTTSGFSDASVIFN